MVGWAKAGSKQKKILVPTKRKQSPFSILHNGMKLGRKIILKRVLEELEPQGRCHQRQEFPLPGRNQEGLAEDVSKRDLTGCMASALAVTMSITPSQGPVWPGRSGRADVARQRWPPEISSSWEQAALSAKENYKKAWRAAAGTLACLSHGAQLLH